MRSLVLFAALGLVLPALAPAAGPDPKAEIEIARLKKALQEAVDQNKALKGRVDKLEADLAEVVKELTRLKAKAGGAGPAKGKDPDAPPNLQGEVTKVDGDLMTLSAGSDSGLVKGHVLEVFRRGAAPKYLGRVRIIEVSPKQSVGQAVGRMAAPVEKGDKVASRVSVK